MEDRGWTMEDRGWRIEDDESRFESDSFDQTVSPEGTAGNSLGRKPQEFGRTENDAPQGRHMLRSPIIAVPPLRGSTSIIDAVPAAFAPGYLLLPLRG